MEQLTWTGSFSVLNPIFLAALTVFCGLSRRTDHAKLHLTCS